MVEREREQFIKTRLVLVGQVLAGNNQGYDISLRIESSFVGVIYEKN